MNYKTLIHIFITVLLSFVVSIWMLQNNSDLQKKLITNLVSTLEKEWGATIAVKQAHANFFTQSIYFSDGAVNPKKHKCHWNFVQGKVTTSIFNLLFKKELHLYLTFINVSGETDYANGQIAIVDHLEDIFKTKQTDFKVIPHSVTLQNINAKGTWNNQTAGILMKGSFTFYKKNNNTFSSKHYELECANSSIFINQSPLIIGLNGKGSLEKQADTSPWKPKLNMVGKLISPKTHYQVRIKNNNHIISIANKTKSINAACSFGAISKLKGTLPGPLLEYWTRIASHSSLKNYTPLLTKEVSSFLLTFKNDPESPEITGRLTIKNNPLFSSLHIRNLLFQNNKLSGTLHAKTVNDINLNGAIDYNAFTQSGSIHFINKSEIALQTTGDNKIITWNIPAEKAQLVGKILPDNTIKGGFYIPFHDILSQQTTILQGNFICQKKEITLRGSLNTNKFVIIIALDPHPHITRLEYINDEQDTSLISLIQNKQNPFLIEGHIAFAAIQSFLPLDMQHAILGKESLFNLQIDQVSLHAIKTSLSLAHGTLYLPESHNLLEHFTLDALINAQEKKIYFSNGTFQFHKGIINCPHASITLEPNFSFKTIHLPLEINDLFINWKKDLYAFVYGNVLITKKSTTPIDITGNILLKKSLLKNDIFTEQANDSVYSPIPSSHFSKTPLHFRLDVATEAPLKIKTPTLNTHATLALTIDHLMSKDEFNIPQVSGYINLEKGSLKLLTQSLRIEYGRLEFPAHQSHDPIIEFTAKNRIQKYLITLHATGTLQKPIITLESFPELQEEQILSLLLGGAEGSGLQTDIATIVLHNLNAILMGSRQFNQKTNAFFKFLTRPLKYVQIVPNFTDQSGRGGIRGIISIDINKQLHAQLQKNFNLQEDFLFQIQYMLADELNIKAIKDQRDELGAELEFRFKL